MIDANELVRKQEEAERRQNLATEQTDAPADAVQVTDQYPLRSSEHTYPLKG